MGEAESNDVAVDAEKSRKKGSDYEE